MNMAFLSISYFRIICQIIYNESLEGSPIRKSASIGKASPLGFFHQMISYFQVTKSIIDTLKASKISNGGVN